ncbi:hypothetical protein AA101099_3000 [Neoasaia chiangmaiensis NBRC 101099]|uniref:Uncharacterized protein n=1 Tax=Neoasaia chiangmaiensis TaxID=320497 RepID=A0A1U9KNN1_9PROT|nr:hypothetical protein [Neoasaia chiangmaiensis]AQS87407.1 hypothetical protein A0U93_05045 [Neoasaia chiangmaiensis]GBR42827.1 hypothetical protein AA101099_3000 [Neoasaia chiangmaiensis NBRC 101099]GEN16179.1 hypothetical protein NCH01_26100 [Neoasaia chiangmaiensis]
MIDGTADMAVLHSDTELRALRARRGSLRQRSARIFATCAQGAWLLLAATPVIVVVCALKG